MRLLLDTNALIWAVSAPDELQPAARTAIIDGSHDVFVSNASLWEIVVKIRVGKLALRLDEVEQVLDAEGFSRLSVEAAHLRTLEPLPMHHRDPFDHLLIAQAICEDLTFVTRDAEAARYPVRVMRC